jgi:hypothetical protein
MSQPLTVELSDTTYAALRDRARESAQSPAELAAVTLEQHFANGDGSGLSARRASDAEAKAARERFERHFGAVNLGLPTSTDNEGIDADLGRAHADSHEQG